MVYISIVGAGSVVFSGSFIRDLCLTKSLWGSTVTLMDIDKERLGVVHNLALRYKDEVKADLKIRATLDRKEALENADFVISTVKVGGYDSMEAERRISEQYNYYRGIGDRVSDYYGGFAAYHQLKFFLDLAIDMEDLCPDAWLIETANPVFEGTTLISRETKIKVIGVCHGHFGYKIIASALGLNPEEVDAQMAGFNHCIWLTHFLHKGRDAYPLIDEWIEKEAPKYWKSKTYLKGAPWLTEQLSPAAVEMYKLYGLFPIGDTVRSVSPWWFHTSLKTKRKWFGPMGGFDSEIGWSLYLNSLKENLKRMYEAARNNSISLTSILPPVMSGEQHIPIIDAIVNDKETKLQLNVPNKGAITGIPENVVVEVPVIVSGRGVQTIHIGDLPKRIMLFVMMPRMLRMEQILQAFLEGDRKSLLLMLMEDHRTKSFNRAKALVDELLAQEWNAEVAKHYVW
ncbi:alpha-glucosidase/alpha-galactosidase [Candidatus Bathyarchaeota archaeon]|nr:alpha-glucosidase/alpha-galactosidase [Candidatus Bathyarchaeota archaeon]